MSARHEPESRTECVYCGGYAGGGCGEDDHWPIPKAAGGKVTVRACLTCHRMVDILSINNWPPEFALRAFIESPREARMLLSKALKVLAHRMPECAREDGGLGFLGAVEADDLDLRPE